MIKTVARLEHQIGDRVYQFTCDNDAPIGEVHDALVKFKAYVVGVIQNAEKPKEEPKPEDPQ